MEMTLVWNWTKKRYHFYNPAFIQENNSNRFISLSNQSISRSNYYQINRFIESLADVFNVFLKFAILYAQIKVHLQLYASQVKQSKSKFNQN